MAAPEEVEGGFYFLFLFPVVVTLRALDGQGCAHPASLLVSQVLSWRGT